MKQITFTLLLSLCTCLSSRAQTGVLDPSFGSGGRVEIKQGYPEGFFISADRMFIVSEDYIFCLHLNGSLDSSFDSDGILRYSYPSSVSGLVFLSVAVQKDGKVVAAGYSGTTNLTLIRYQANGKIDSSFGANGIVTGGTNVVATSLLIANDGKIVVGTNRFFLLRYKANGDIDSGFGSNGITSSTMSCRINSIAMTANDHIIAAGVGYANPNSYDKFVMAGQYDANGQFDNTFGDSGRILDTLNKYPYSTFYGYEDHSGMAIQADGKILISGSIYIDGGYNSFIKRYTPSGRADNSFDSDGTLITDIDSQYNFGAAIIALPGGDIIQGGSAGTDSLFSFKAVMLRYKSDGSIDSSFGTDGKVVTASSTSSSMVVGLGLQPGNNKLISVAYDKMASGSFMTVISRYSSGLNSGISSLSVQKQSVAVYPNPINDQPVLTFALNQSDDITIRLLDMQGREVKTFTDSEQMEAGTHTITLNMPELAQGIYFINLSGHNGQASVKVER